MTRRCSHCSNNGHNSRTCPSRGAAGGGSSGGGGGVGVGGLGGGGVKLFGVRLTDGSIIKKSASMGNLLHYQSSAAATSPNPGSPSSDPPQDPAAPLPDGYLSDDPNHASCSSNRRTERKKGDLGATCQLIFAWPLQGLVGGLQGSLVYAASFKLEVWI